MNDYAMTPPTARGGMRLKHILLLLLIAFIGGVVGTGWLANRMGYWDGGFTSRSTDVPETLPTIVTPPFSAVAPPNDTVASIENRLTQINADAAAASGNAARAEGLLVAFAARRAIDSGAPLGYLADQLRLRFGASQPQAVATILAASQAPVTLEALQAELGTLDTVLLTGERDAGAWATIRREFSELFVLRRDGSPSPAPTQRLLRAHVLAESGNIGGAVAEVLAMPGAPSAQGWLTKARRYSQARKALDVLERSAIIAPAPVAMPPVSTAREPTVPPPPLLIP